MKMVAVPCRISRSPFSAERIFRITLPNGAVHAGTALREYCWNRLGTPLGQEEPAPGQVLEGLVAGQWLEDHAGGALVYLPDGETVLVDRNRLVAADIPDKEVRPHVSLGS
jgi:hypothetical protein